MSYKTVNKVYIPVKWDLNKWTSPFQMCFNGRLENGFSFEGTQRDEPWSKTNQVLISPIISRTKVIYRPLPLYYWIHPLWRQEKCHWIQTDERWNLGVLRVCKPTKSVLLGSLAARFGATSLGRGGRAVLESGVTEPVTVSTHYRGVRSDVTSTPESGQDCTCALGRVTQSYLPPAVFRDPDLT